MDFSPEHFDMQVINGKDISYMDDLFLDEEGRLKIVPYDTIKHIPQDEISLFCTQKGFYCLPTQELINFLKEEIGDSKAIEIGSGNGAICKALGIPGTDNYMQAQPEIASLYGAMQQTVVPYGPHIEKLDAKDAVRKYKPEVVVASWVTHKYNPKEHWRGGNAIGVNEKLILEKTKKYIVVGNEKVHGKKPIMRHNHRTIREPWLVSRSLSPELNVIYIWE